MWHCSALFFLRRFPGLSECVQWKDPLHLLLQPANYNTVIKRTQKQLPPYITVSDKHTATSSCAMLSPSQKGGELRLAHLVWLLPEDTENPECCLTWSSVENEHTPITERLQEQELQPRWSHHNWMDPRGQRDSGVVVAPSPPWNNLFVSQLLLLVSECLQRF